MILRMVNTSQLSIITAAIIVLRASFINGKTLGSTQTNSTVINWVTNEWILKENETKTNFVGDPHGIISLARCVATGENVEMDRNKLKKRASDFNDLPEEVITTENESTIRRGRAQDEDDEYDSDRGRQSSNRRYKSKTSQRNSDREESTTERKTSDGPERFKININEHEDIHEDHEYSSSLREDEDDRRNKDKRNRDSDKVENRRKTDDFSRYDENGKRSDSDKPRRTGGSDRGEDTTKTRYNFEEERYDENRNKSKDNKRNRSRDNDNRKDRRNYDEDDDDDDYERRNDDKEMRDDRKREKERREDKNRRGERKDDSDSGKDRRTDKIDRRNRNEKTEDKDGEQNKDKSKGQKPRLIHRIIIKNKIIPWVQPTTYTGTYHNAPFYFC